MPLRIEKKAVTQDVEIIYCEICNEVMEVDDDKAFLVRASVVFSPERGKLFFHEKCLFDEYQEKK